MLAVGADGAEADATRTKRANTPSAIHSGVALGNASASPTGAGSYGAASPVSTERTGTNTLPVWASTVSVGAVTRIESGPASAVYDRESRCLRLLGLRNPAGLAVCAMVG